MTDDIGSWEERIDWCLGRAGTVLDTAAERFITSSLDTDAAEAAAPIAEAFRDLAAHWRERIEDEPFESEDEDEDELVEVSQ